MHVILFTLIGLIAGAFARLNVPGREPGGWATPSTVGVFGSLAGGLLGRAFALEEHGQTAGPLMSMFGAVVALSAYQALAGLPEST